MVDRSTISELERPAPERDASERTSQLPNALDNKLLPKQESSRPRVLMETHDLTLKSGTGIAIYTRGLAIAARSQNFRPIAVFGANMPVPRKGGAFQEIRLNDVHSPHSRRLLYRLTAATRRLVGAPDGARPVSIKRQGVVVNSMLDTMLAEFDEAFVASELNPLAQRTFELYGHFLPMRFDTPPDIFHASRPVPLRVRGRPNVYTIHDLVPLRLPYATLGNKRLYFQLIRRIAERADHIVTVSEHTKKDLLDLFNVDEQRVTVTHQAVSFPPYVLSKSDDEVQRELRAAFRLEAGQYYIFVGAIEPKKNLARLIEAFMSVETDRPLVIVGGLGWLYDDDLKIIEQASQPTYQLENSQLVAKRRVIRLQYQSRAKLITLIRGARALLFPSVHEGFGLPVLEAMLLGTPVLTSNASALPEVAGDAAVLVDPFDTESIASGLRILENDDDLLAELRIRGRRRAAFFSPENIGQRVGSVYNALLGRRA